MASPIQVNIVHERPAPHVNEGANLAARKITLLALSVIATLVSFTVLPFEGAFVATLGCITLFSLLSLSSGQPRNDEGYRPVRWYQYINPVHYFPRWNLWRPRLVTQFVNTAPVHHVHRPHPEVFSEVRREVPTHSQVSRVPVGDHGRRRAPHPSAFSSSNRERNLPAEYAPYPMPNTQNTPSLFERHPLPTAPAGSVAGIPVRQPGDRVPVGRGHREPPSDRPLYQSAALESFVRANDPNNGRHASGLNRQSEARPMSYAQAAARPTPHPIPTRAPVASSIPSRIPVGGRRH